MRCFLCCLLCLISLAACGTWRQAASTTPLPPGTYHRSIKSGGKTRDFTLVVPKSYDGRSPVPVVMLLHGYTGTADGLAYYSQFQAKAEREGFILVLPQGLGHPAGWNCGWINLGQAGVDDVAFLTELLDLVEASAQVDRRREYIGGHSNGAFMSYVLGSKLAGRIAAIGVVAGTIGTDRGARVRHVDGPAKPVSAIIFHGRADRMVPYNHEPGLLTNCASAYDSARFWAQADGIGTEPVHQVVSPQIEIDDYRGGKGVEVKLVSFAKGSHMWPGALLPGGMEKDAGASATDLMWEFFNAHPLPN